jgi:hypothetical protein
MVLSVSLFYVNLPNATTWFCFSFLLAGALFFKFTRVLSVRNWDIITLFLLAPGLLILQEAHAGSDPGQANPGLTLKAGTVNLTLLWYGYLWLLCGSAYFLFRSFLDLTLVRRPALGPNLNMGGLAWLGLAMFACLSVVAARGPVAAAATVGKPSVVVKEVQTQSEKVVKQGPAGQHISESDMAFLVKCTTAMICHLAIVIGLVFIGWRHFQDVLSGMAMATCYLLLPYTAYLVDQVHHVLPTAFLVWAVAAYRLPTLSGLLIGFAIGTGYFPALLFPAWLSFYWRRGAGRFAGAVLLALAVCFLYVAFIMWLDGDLVRRIQETLAQSDWQPWKTTVVTEGFWTDMRWAWAYRLPVFIAFLALVATTLFWPRPKNLAHLLALSVAVILGIQFWYADRGGVYVLWYLPFLLLLVFRPNLSDREPAAIVPEKDWLTRWRLALGRFSSRLLRLPEPTVHVH